MGQDQRSHGGFPFKGVPPWALSLLGGRSPWRVAAVSRSLQKPMFLAYSVLLWVAGPLESRASEESRPDCGWREGGPGWDLGLCLPTSPSDSEAVSDCVFSLSSPVPVSPFPLCCQLSSFAVSTSCLLALLRPQHPGGSEALCPWYVSGSRPSLLPLAPAALLLPPLHRPGPPPPPLLLLGDPQAPAQALPALLSSAHPSPVGPARALRPRSSDSPL